MIKILELDKRIGSSMWTTNHRFFWETAGAGVIAGIGSLLGSGISGVSQSKMSKEQLALQEKLFHENWDNQRRENLVAFERSADFEREMFNAENLYNSPIELLKRLEAAGINPQVALNGSLGSASSNAASGGNAVSPATSPGNVPSVPREFSPFESIGQALKTSAMDIAQLYKVRSEIKRNDTESERTKSLLDAEIDKYVSEAEKNRSIVGLNEIKTNMENLNYEFDKMYKGKQMSANLRKTTQEVEKLIKETNVLVLQGNVLKAEEKLKEAQTAYTKTKDTQAQEFFAYACATAEQNIALMKSQENLNYTNAAKIREETSQLISMRDDILSKAHWSAENQRIEAGLNAKEFKKVCDTYTSEVRRLNNHGFISDAVLREAESKAAMAEKENNLYYLREGIDMVCDVANTAANVAKPWASVSNNVRDNKTRSENNIRDNESRTKNYYDVDYDGKGNTKGARKRVYGNVR